MRHILLAVPEPGRAGLLFWLRVAAFVVMIAGIALGAFDLDISAHLIGVLVIVAICLGITTEVSPACRKHTH